METLCGKVRHIEIKIDASGRVRADITIGDRSLDKVRCEPGVPQNLRLEAEACVYIFWHFHIWPVLLGIRHPDGSRSLATANWIRTVSVQYFVGYAVIAAFVGGFIGEVVGALTGIGTFLGGVGFAFGFVDSIWSGFRIRSDYDKAQRD